MIYEVYPNSLLILLKVFNLLHNLTEDLRAVLRRISVLDQANLDIKF